MDTEEVNMALTKVTQGLFKDFVNKVLAVMQNHSNIFLGTAKAATGTFVDFDIPAGVKRVTVMFDGVSTNGASYIQIQVGAGAFQTSGYAATGKNLSDTTLSTITSTTGFTLGYSQASESYQGLYTLMPVNGNTWLIAGVNHSIGATSRSNVASGRVTLSDILDRIRITTVNGTDQFDAGTINVSWEF
jgi:hypothetical protein